MARFQGDLPERTYQFARCIVSLVRRLPHETAGWKLAGQLMKSGTAVGANVCEADAALTDREFIQFSNIARREALETRFWLRLARDESLLDQAIVIPALQESEALSRILTTIVRKSRDHLLHQANR